MSTNEEEARALLVEKIDNYLAGTLTPEDKAAFEDELLHSAELREELAFQQSLNYAIAHQDKQTLIRDMAEAESLIKSLLQQDSLQLDTLGTETESTQPGRVVSMWQRMEVRYAMAIVLVLTAGIVSWWVTTTDMLGSNDGPTLYASYYSTPEWEDFAGAPRGYGAEVLAEVKASYAGGDYKNALKNIDKAINQYPQLVELSFYKGIILLELGKDKDAERTILSFMDASQNTDGATFAYQQHARWYLALAQVKQKKYDEARTNLHPLMEDLKNPLSRKAGDLYTEIQYK